MTDSNTNDTLDEVRRLLTAIEHEMWSIWSGKREASTRWVCRDAGRTRRIGSILNRPVVRLWCLPWCAVRWLVTAGLERHIRAAPKSSSFSRAALDAVSVVEAVLSGLMRVGGFLLKGPELVLVEIPAAVVVTGGVVAYAGVWLLGQMTHGVLNLIVDCVQRMRAATRPPGAHAIVFRGAREPGARYDAMGDGVP